ncbi:MAG: hypothetical protein H8D34_00165 [Chloroflexi bacterium]|nr:hypothetical protein [Chloroflexota bacterium]
MTAASHRLEITEWIGEGYHPCVDFGEWRVAILRYISELAPENIQTMERHNETDEVFVLLHGRCVLFIGEGESEIAGVYPVEMQPHKLYNVKKGVYHTHTLSQDAIVLVVENRNTGEMNSDCIPLMGDQREQLVAMSRAFDEKSG